MAAGVDAAGNLDLQVADLVLALQVAEALRDALGDRNGACVGEVAVVEARAGDDVGHQADVRRAETARLQHLPHLGEVGETHMRSEEHTSELQSLMRISYAVFCCK